MTEVEYMHKIVNLCQSCDKCPVVEVTDSAVNIGEKGNLCTLKYEEWESLRQKILSGEL
ncbi:hypothetical protein HY639_01995 [Candidatus Woesearchaeota archaeon]|nr:hypothetical protein [Candidatus Woesearchaeota archaeon]